MNSNHIIISFEHGKLNSTELDCPGVNKPPSEQKDGDAGEGLVS